jgi:hypothetical protein
MFPTTSIPMKRWFLSILALFSVTGIALGQRAWVNNELVIGAPQIDAETFVNNGIMEVFLTNGAINIQLFDTSSTLNFTNSSTGIMEGEPGFRFDTAPAVTGLRKRASTFFNDGFINVGSFTNRLNQNFLNVFAPILGGTLVLSAGFSELVADATNLVNSGNMNVGVDGLLSLKGNSVDLTRSALSMEGFETNLFANVGIFDNYWGLGTNLDNPFALYDFQPPFTPIHSVTQLLFGFYVTLQTQFELPGALTYDSGYIPDNTGTNLFRKVVFLAETNSAMSNNVFFVDSPEGDVIVEWQAHYIHPITGTPFTNYMYLFDSMDSITNLVVLTNNFGQFNIFFPPPLPTFRPTNFFFFRGGPLFLGLTPSPQTIPPPFPGRATNAYSAYSALFQPTTRVVTNVSGQALTNLPGRIEITADDILNLDHTRIAGLNYLKLSASNHFAGNEGADIVVPFADMYLGSTNGHLVITNLLRPDVPRFTGEVDLYAGRWTNAADPGPGFNTIYHVLLVNSLMSPTSPSELQDLTLKASDITISDRMNVERGFLVDAVSLTLTTNAPGAYLPRGELNLNSGDIIWSSAAPRLQYLTNNGAITALNAIHFGGARTSPYNSLSSSDWYVDLINSGLITDVGTLIWANYFQDSGIIDSGLNSTRIQSVVVLMTNDVGRAGQDISISSGDLLISNNVMTAGAAISLSVTNALDDGSLACNSADNVTNKNSWFTGNGFNLTNRPVSGSLLATTVSETAPPYRAVPHLWAGADLGCSPAGFVNNSAVGQLILDGQFQSRFDFLPANGNNAIYVDHLDLEDWTTNQNNAPGGNGDFIGIFIAPGMKVYYSDATENGLDISFKLNGKNGGRFCWVSNYNCGFYSSTNIAYPNGTTNRVNRALAEECARVGSTIDVCIPAPEPCACNPPIVVFPINGGSTNSNGGGGNGGTGSTGSTLPRLDFPGGAGADANVVSTAYNGLFYETNGINASSSGYFSATVTAAKTFTAKVAIGGKVYPFSGRFDGAGNALVRLARGSLRALTVRLQLDPASGSQIRGTVSDGQWTANLVADRAGFSRKAKFSTAPSTYTLTIPGLATPTGHGFGTVKVGVDGTVQFSGSLSDGTKVTQQSALSANGTWPLYVPLYGGSGCLLSWIQVTNNASVNGDIVWIKPSVSSAKYYPSGFTNQTQLSGIPYHAPAAHSRVLNLNGGNGQLLLYSTEVGGALTNNFSVDLNNRVTDLSGNQLKLIITPSTGLFHGTVLNPNNGKVLPFQGALFEDWNSGFGYFLGPSQSGQVYLGPTP